MTKKTSTPTKPPEKTAKSGVEQDHRDDGDGAQAVDLGPILHSQTLLYHLRDPALPVRFTLR